MELYGKKLTRVEVEERVPDIHQLCGTRHYELVEGATRGTRAVDVDAGDLKYTVILDRGMDISKVSYKGINLTHLTENGEIHPSFYESRASEWARIFFGGLLTTCGLTYLGPPCVDGNEQLGLHGRYSSIPARKVKDNSDWNGDDYVLCLEGVIDETVQMGTKMRLTRTISSKAGEGKIRIHDVVKNTGSSNAPFTLLYHINFGYPLLDDESEILIQSKEILPFEEYSASQKYKCMKISPPKQGFMEENYFCPCAKDKNGYTAAMIVNEKLIDGVGVCIRASAETLPYFCYWKMLDTRDYIIALEPSNVVCESRATLRERGQLPILEPGEEKIMDIEISVIEGKDAIAATRSHIKTVLNE